MKGIIPVLVALAILAASPLASAQGGKRSENQPTQFRFQSSPKSSFLLNRPPLFSLPLAGSGSRSSNNMLPFSNHPFRSPGFFLWGQSRWGQSRWNQGQRFNPSPYSFFSSYGDYGGPTDSQNNGVKSFIEQWGNQDPFAPKLGSSLSGSSLLSPGMTEEEVTRLLGSPIEKISSGEVQIWKYSSFSLRFEDDKLKGLQ